MTLMIVFSMAGQYKATHTHTMVNIPFWLVPCCNLKQYTQSKTLHWNKLYALCSLNAETLLIYTHHKRIPCWVGVPCLCWEIHGVTSWESCSCCGCSLVKRWKTSIHDLSIRHSTDSHTSPPKST